MEDHYLALLPALFIFISMAFFLPLKKRISSGKELVYMFASMIIALAAYLYYVLAIYEPPVYLYIFSPSPEVLLKETLTSKWYLSSILSVLMIFMIREIINVSKEMVLFRIPNDLIHSSIKSVLEKKYGSDPEKKRWWLIFPMYEHGETRVIIKKAPAATRLSIKCSDSAQKKELFLSLKKEIISALKANDEEVQVTYELGGKK